MTERLIISLLLAALAIALFWLARQAHARRATGQLSPSGRARLLYFRGDHCAPCVTQSHFLDELAPVFAGKVQFEQIDVEREREAASRFAVFTLPTTLLIDGRGQVRHINYGLTPAGKLARQLEEIA